MLFVLIVYFILSLVIGSAASQRGRSAFGWFLVSILTTPLLAGVFLLLFPSLNDPTSVDDKALQEAIRRGRPVGPPQKLGVRGLTVSLTILLSAIIAAMVWNGNVIHFINELTAPSTNNAPTIIPSPLQEQTMVPRGSEKPSFDCEKAKTAAARLICADAELARLDAELGVVFQKRKRQLPATEQPKFVADQLAWIKDRNIRCELVEKNSAAIEVLASSKSCMVNTIRERIAFLTQTGSSFSAGAPLQLLGAFPSQSDQATQPPIIRAGCHRDGDVVTIQGVATAQSLELANGSVKGVWLFVTDRPFCVIESPDGVDAPREISIPRLQIIGQPPPPGATIELTGRLSTGNISQYYAVSTAISVISGRRIAVPSAPNVALDSPKFDADQVAALLDKRDPAMTALEEIAPTMANNDSQQLISALGAVEGSWGEGRLQGSLTNCASIAASRGSRSAVNILKNECSREYLDWFPTCAQTAKACATTALFMSRIGIEAYEKCLGEFDRTACNPTDPDSYFVRGPAAH